jgi:delta 1-pyrroline-5-carboxylate dehydrogenase
MRTHVQLARTARTALFATLALAACASSSGGGPQETLRRYVAAIEADQPVAAYALLDESQRRQLSQAEFVARWRTLKPELKAQAAQLQAALQKPIGARAMLVYPSGTRAVLSLDPQSRWQIEEGIAVTPHTATPIDAIRAFIRAVESRSYEAVTKLLAKSVRENIEQDIVDRMAKLKAALGQEIEVTGNKAKLQYDAKYKIELLNEDGQWRVLDID